MISRTANTSTLARPRLWVTTLSTSTPSRTRTSPAPVVRPTPLGRAPTIDSAPSRRSSSTRRAATSSDGENANPHRLQPSNRETVMTTHPEGESVHDRPVRPRVAAALAVGCLIVTAFQAALTFGAPFGAAAVGGTIHGQLPGAIRLVTGFQTAVWLSGALLVLARGGRAVVALPDAVSRIGIWVLVGLLGLGAVMNFASSSPWERFGWGPFSLVLFTLGVVLARSGTPASRAVTR
jgi:hypothetical protein